MRGIKLNTGATIPSIGFGTWQILLNGRAKRAVRSALNLGYRLIDTARIYGNEKGVGEAIRESGISRQEIFVTTKLWNFDQGYDKALRAFDASLGRLGLDYVDLYLIHWLSRDKRRDSWKALQAIYKSGRAKAIGVSNYTTRHLEELLGDSSVVPAVNQVEFHPYIYDEQKGLLEFCKQQGIILEAYSPLAQATRLKDDIVQRVATKLNKTPAQVMLRWCLQHGTVPLPKTTHIERMEENLAVFDFKIPSSDMKVLDNLSSHHRTSWDPSGIS